MGCALLLPCAQTADWAQQRLWQAQCADEPPDVTYLDAGASLNLHEWRGRARVYRRWLCDALQGLPAVWEDTAADVVQCGPDPECLHDLVVVATRNWELALGDDAVVLVPGPSANASGPEPGAAPPDPPRAPPPPPRPPKPSLHKMEPQSTSGLQPLAPPVTVAVPAGPRHSKALRGAWTPELMRTVTSAMRLPAAALKVRGARDPEVHWKGGGYPPPFSNLLPRPCANPPPPRAPSLRPANVPLTPSARLNATDSNGH